MRGSILPLLLVGGLLIAPAALANQTIEFMSPAPRQPVVPQMFCEIVYDAPGTQRCDVVGQLSRATELSIVMAGGAGSVRVLLDDKSQPITRQIAYVECSSITCRRDFDPVLTPHAELHIYSTGAQGHSVSVSVAKDVNEGLNTL